MSRPRMIGQVLHPYNLQKALGQVIANKGGAGIDGKRTDGFADYFREHKASILQSIKDDTYLPKPILGVGIPKGNGKTRLLGIPTVTDRLLQQAVSHYLMPKYEHGFSVHSYGFRPHKNARQAVGKVLEHIHGGNTFIVDIDLKTFFDEVDHCLLLNLLYQKVKCPTTLRLVWQVGRSDGTGQCARPVAKAFAFCDPLSFPGCQIKRFGGASK